MSPCFVISTIITIHIVTISTGAYIGCDTTPSFTLSDPALSSMSTLSSAIIWFRT